MGEGIGESEMEELVPEWGWTWRRDKDIVMSLRSPSVSIRQLKLQATCALWFMCKRIMVNIGAIPEVWELGRFQRASDFQDHWKSLALVSFHRPHMICY